MGVCALNGSKCSAFYTAVGFLQMDYVAACCSVLRCVALKVTWDTPSHVLQCIAVCCSVLQCVCVAAHYISFSHLYK